MKATRFIRKSIITFRWPSAQNLRRQVSSVFKSRYCPCTKAIALNKFGDTILPRSLWQCMGATSSSLAEDRQLKRQPKERRADKVLASLSKQQKYRPIIQNALQQPYHYRHQECVGLALPTKGMFRYCLLESNRHHQRDRRHPFDHLVLLPQHPPRQSKRNQEEKICLLMCRTISL